MATDDTESEDERDIELSALAAIFPELVVEPVVDDERKAHLDIEVNLDTPITVDFAPLSRQNTQASHLSVREDTTPIKDTVDQLRSESGKPHVSLVHLPSLTCHITLQPSYPTSTAPIISLNSHTPWLPDRKIRKLEQQVTTLWEENGRSVVLYDYFDWLGQSSRAAFDITNTPTSATLILSRELEAPLLDFDLQAKKRKFAGETIDCGVCLEPKKGAVCHKMTQCGHVFCVECLQDFYNNCITEGHVTSVKCLDPSCEKDRLKGIPERRRKRVDLTIQPSELLEIPLDQEKVQRFVYLKRKKELESNRNVVFCPRRWCKGAARSEKKKKTVEDPDTESEDEKMQSDKPLGDRLAICSECNLAFCNRCLTGPWHGEHVWCRPPRTKGELSAEELATEAYLTSHSARCPTCGAPVQKTMGCNHMVCQLCRTHFCYLCQAFLMESNPYEHFNSPGQGCYQRLFVLEEGDDEFAQLAELVENDSDSESDNDSDEEDPNVHVPPANQNVNANGGPRIEFADDTPSSEEDEVAPPAQRGRRGGRGGRARGAERGRGGRGRGRGRGGGPPPARAGRGGPAARGGGAPVRARDGGPYRGAAPNEAVGAGNAPAGAARGGLQRFVQMALNDQEDEWDSDELGSDSDDDWVIPVRGRVP
jgi:E3 ubiquitin-protein ligase RNF14